ncbi:hypothetical protein [Sagittula sp.]|uniref:hypothetical protein n=1 Tax=Sagittula sp. TaxID=2038081 RepID=UPI003516EB25
MARRGIQGLDDLRLAEKLEKSLLKAQKKVGKKIGQKFISKRKRRLGAASKRRKAAVRYVVGKTGELVVLDLAPMAWSQEFGAVIRPENAPEIFVRTGPPLQSGEKPVRRGDYLLATKPRQKPRLLGVYKTEVRVKRVGKGQRFFDQAEPLLDEYLEEIEDNLEIDI